VRVEESKYNNLYEKKIVHHLGNFYFFKDYVISEINEGIHFNYENGKEIIDMAYEHYGEGIKVAYISNRVNSYSLDPRDWITFYKERHKLEAFAIVAYNKIGIMNAVLEKLFSQTRIGRFDNLDEAVNWVMTIHKEKETMANQKNPSE